MAHDLGYWFPLHNTKLETESGTLFIVALKYDNVHAKIQHFEQLLVETLLFFLLRDLIFGLVSLTFSYV